MADAFQELPALLFRVSGDSSCSALTLAASTAVT